MHRGRHRSRKPAEGQTTSTSQQSGSATSSGPTGSVIAAAGASRTSTPTPGSTLSHSNLRPSILSGNSQSTTTLGGGMGYSSPSGSGGLSGGSSPAASSQFQLPSLSSPSGTSALTSKDYRYHHPHSSSNTHLQHFPPFTSVPHVIRHSSHHPPPSLTGLTLPMLPFHIVHLGFGLHSVTCFIPVVTFRIRVFLCNIVGFGWFYPFPIRFFVIDCNVVLELQYQHLVLGLQEALRSQ